MKYTIWQKKAVVIYIGGDPAKGEAPEITLEIEQPQFQFDSDKPIVTIVEAK